MKNIFIVTLFPDAFKQFTDSTLIQRFLHRYKVEIKTIYLGDCSDKGFKGVDSSPYGGGQGMVIRADVLKKSLEFSYKSLGYKEDFASEFKNKFHVVYTSPRGEKWSHLKAQNFAKKIFEKENLLFICGRYEGIDERFIQKYVDQIFSIGDFVLMGGELPVQIILDSTLRFVDGVLGNKNSAQEDSFENGLIEHAQYTKPQKFENLEVPEVLLSGNHEKIKLFRAENSIEMTKKFRDDLLIKK